MTFTQMASIPNTAKRCAHEQLGITAWQIRGWIKTGALKCTHSGRTALIYWPNLLAFLENGAPEPEAPREPVPYGTMRRIKE